MFMPDWNDSSLKAGTMVRGALWLLQVVGIGNTFTKDQVREAFPGISQADRRIRDLRDFGWSIHANTEDASLSSSEQRFVSAGVSVWDSKARRFSESSRITKKERLAILAMANYQCQRCGISAGQFYPDDPQVSAVLLVAISTSGSKEAVCRHCHSGGADKTLTENLDVWREITGMSDQEKTVFYGWTSRNKRGVTRSDRAWKAYTALGSEEKLHVQNFLKS